MEKTFEESNAFIKATNSTFPSKRARCPLDNMP